MQQRFPLSFSVRGVRRPERKSTGILDCGALRADTYEYCGLVVVFVRIIGMMAWPWDRRRTTGHIYTVDVISMYMGVWTMLWHVNNRKLLCYVGLFSAIAAVLCFRTGNWVIAGIFLPVSASAFALRWLAGQHMHLHSK